MSRTAKTILKILLFVGALFLVLLLTMCQIGPKLIRDRYLEEDPFPNYQIYDYHLRCVDDGAKVGKYRPDSSFYRLTYRLIENVDEEMAVSVNVVRPMLYGVNDYDFVLQNPDEYVDVLREWTVASIQLYWIPVVDNEEYTNQWGEPETILYRTTDTAIWDEIVKVIDEREERNASLRYDETSPNREKYALSEDAVVFFRSFSPIRLCLRIEFSESSSIVWETRIRFVDNGVTSECFLTMDAGAEAFLYVPNTFSAFLEKESPLYRAVVAALQAYREE